MPRTHHIDDTDHEAAKENFLQKMRTLGFAIRPNQVCICQYCEEVYKLCLPKGASRNHCSSAECRMAYDREEAARNRQQSRARMRLLRAVGAVGAVC